MKDNSVMKGVKFWRKRKGNMNQSKELERQTIPHREIGCAKDPRGPGRSEEVAVCSA